MAIEDGLRDAGQRKRRELLTIPIFLRPPSFRSRLEEARARCLAPILILSAVVAVIVLVALPFTDADEPVPLVLSIYLLLGGMTILSGTFLKAGRVLAAGRVYGIGAWLVTVAAIVSYGGLVSHVMVIAVSVVIVSGFVWSERAAAIMAGGYSVAALVLAWGQEVGLFSIEPREVVWWRSWLGFTVALATSGLLLTIGLRRIRAALEEVSQSETLVRASRERLRQLADRLETVREEERKSVSRTVHDELGQGLTALKLDLSRRLSFTSGPAGDELASMISRIDQMIEVVRNLSTRLRPNVLDTLGLSAAVEWEVDRFAERSGVACSVDAGSVGLDGSLDARRATAVFRIVQEALTNVARHAGANHASVRLARDNGALVVEVSDDGVGIPEESVWSASSSGLIGIRERAGSLGGTVDIERRPEGGTRLSVRVPL